MEESSLLKTNFIGRDGFVWWIGQIAQEKAWAKQAQGEGWGVRYKVRIMGYHPETEAELPDTQLPWAQVMIPGGTGAANSVTTVKYRQGDVVIGFFLDGDNAQVPVIMGAFANSVYRKSDDAFTPFGTPPGLTEDKKKPSPTVIKSSDSGDQNSKSAESAANLPPSQAKKQKKDNPATTTSSDGKLISFACDVGDEKGSGKKKKSKTTKKLEEIRNSIQGFVEDIQEFKANIDEDLEFARDWIKDKIDDKAEAITKDVSGLVGEMVKGTFTELAPVLGQGLNFLYADVFGKTLAATGNPIIAHGFGVGAQTATLPAVSALADFMECVVEQVLGQLTGVIADILKSVADNILNFADCIADQTLGAVLNGIINLLNSGILPFLEGLTKILQFFENFNFQDFMRNIFDTVLGLLGLSKCLKPKENDKYGACKYRLGYGPVSSADIDLSKLIGGSNAANAASAVAEAGGFPLEGVQDIVGSFDFFSDAISDPEQFVGDPESCFGGFPTICSPPKIKIFGGGGEGAEANPILGAIAGVGLNRTGSIIDVKVTNPGNNYTFPPFVEITDNCGQGYGCIARSIIKDGKLDSIYVVSTGENYPVGEVTPLVVSSITIANPGFGYQEGDQVVDNLGNQYDVQIKSGSIIKVTPINSNDVTDIPILRVISGTGSDAALYPNLDTRPDFQGEVKQVIDCVT